MLTVKAIPVIEGHDKIDGFHLMWDPFLRGHLPLSGYSIYRRKSSGRDKPTCRLIDGTALQTLHSNFFLYFNTTKFIRIAFRPMHPDFPHWPHPVNNAINTLAAPLSVFAYDVYFSEPLFGTSIIATIKPDTRFMFAVAYKERRVVRSKFVKDNLAVEFEEPVDKITIYIPGMAESIRVCYTEVNPGKDEDWQLIKKNLCLPFAGFGENATTAQQEYQLFQSRLNDDLAPDAGHFNNISSLLKDTSNGVSSSLLPATSVMKFMDTPGNSGQRMNAAPFNMLQMFSVYHNWRMGLGFGYLDKQGLEENQIYDYKITASFHKNADETIFDFHTIPLNTRVGPAFSLDSIFIYVDAATVVDSFSSANDIFVKGIRVNGAIKFTFPQNVTNFALYCVPEPGATIRVNGIFGTIAVKERVEIKLSSAADNVILLGKFSFVGIAYPSLATGTNPRDVMTETGYCLHQKFTNTKRLLAPASLNAVNLQTSTMPGEHKAPEGLGFRLSWEHPSGYDDAIDPATWPPDVPFPPPAELGYYKLEYMNSSMNPADHWRLHDENVDADPTGIILPGDDYYAAPLPVSFGADLLKVFPAGRMAGGTFTTFQRFKHLLENKAGNITAVPGAFYKYRIWTVDLTGRISLLATETVPARLEKRLAPPAPAGLADKYILPIPDPGYDLPDPRTELRPQNVYAKVLLASSSNLTAQERSLLGNRDHITILTWTWGEEERSLDSYAKEFRVYIRTNEHGLIKGSLAAAATANGTDYNIESTVDTAVVADEFAGSIITLNRVVFRIVSHDAGTSVTMRVSPPRTQPGAVPMPGNFTLYRRPLGEESRPLSWSQRIAVVPMIANKVYQYILETGHLVGAINLTGLEGIGYDITALGSSTRCWLGVSAADAEPYVDDQLTTGTFSLRAGNEGSIVTAPVQVKYVGRPEFNPPPPLDDVDTLPLDEVNSDNLLFAVTPLDQLPFLQATDHLQIERITGTDLLSLLIVTDNAIRLSDAENRDIVTDWLLNPADETELRNAFANSAKPIPAKFIWAIAKKNELHLDELWKVITNTPVNCASLFKDYIPNRTDRYIYLAKLTNELGIASEAAALFPAVWRTKDKTIPPAVTMDAWQLTETATGASAAPVIKLDAGVAVSVKGILVFPGSLEQSVTDEELRMASLVKIPNRPDFLSEQLYRVHVNGNFVEPVFVPVAEADLETAGPSSVYSWNHISFNFPFEQTACVWAAAVSNDNVISKLGSFRKQFTGLTPPAVPDLSAEAVPSGLQLTFNAGGDGSLLYRIEKLVNGEYAPVSGWIVGAAGANEVKQPMPAVTSNYRLKIKMKNNREYAGNPVEIII